MPSLTLARSLLGSDLLGPQEMVAISGRLGVAPPEPELCPEVPANLLERVRTTLPDTFLLLFGTPAMADGSPLTLNALRDHFGVDPSSSEPCFYNQDWYVKEAFASAQGLSARWYLLRKSVREDSRGQFPGAHACDQDAQLPSALLCAFAFFAYYFHSGGRRLWDIDYVWCSDLDHQQDRIYVGRYTDPAGINKNGFSVHRHLSIRRCYGIADLAT